MDRLGSELAHGAGGALGAGQRTDLVAVGAKSLDQTPADETRAAGDKGAPLL
jgi:hypothetical protein